MIFSVISFYNKFNTSLRPPLNTMFSGWVTIKSLSGLDSRMAVVSMYIVKMDSYLFVQYLFKSAELMY